MRASLLLQWGAACIALTGGVIALRALLGRHIGAGLRYALWLPVLVRLLIPVPLFSPPTFPAPPAPRPGIVDTTPFQLLPDPLPQEGTEMPDVSPVPSGEPSLPDRPAVRTSAAPHDLHKWVWLLGSVVTAGTFILANLRFCRRLRRVRVPLTGVPCSLPVYVAPGLPSPCLFGVFRPAVYLTPEAAEDPEILCHVLIHEETHFRHGDHLWSLLRCAAVAVHWWNPLVRLAARLSRQDAELACDAGALKRLGEDHRRAYGETLLALVTAPAQPGDLLCWATIMSDDRRDLQERVQRIAREPRRWLWATVLAAALAVLACACSFSGSRPLDEGKAAGASGADDGDQPAVMAIPGGEGRREDFFTVLILGRDSANDGSTDTLLLAGCDLANRRATVLSIPRDTMVDVPWDLKKINTVYHFHGGGEAGTQALRQTVAQLVGFEPDYQVLVDWQAVGKIVDALGGVTFDVPLDMDYEDPYQDLVIHQKQGLRLLSGSDAMQVLRYRRGSDPKEGYPDGDLGRIRTQQGLLAALTERVLQERDPAVLAGFVKIVKENVETDLSAANLLWLLQTAAWKPEDVSFVTLPCSAAMAYSTAAGMMLSYLVPDPEALPELLNSGLNPYTRPLTPADLDLMSVDEAGSVRSSKGAAAKTSDPTIPSEQAVLAAREAALAGMTEAQVDRLDHVIREANLWWEFEYLYRNFFAALEDPNSLSWNQFDHKGGVQLGWEIPHGIDMEAVCAAEGLTEEEFYRAYCEPAIVENKHDTSDFLAVMDELISTAQNETLLNQLRYIREEARLATEQHSMVHANNQYKALHDLDYFLLSYGPTDMGPYMDDPSTVSKYYGTLPFYP